MQILFGVRSQLCVKEKNFKTLIYPLRSKYMHAAAAAAATVLPNNDFSNFVLQLL
jgi:hypothetical protein